MAREARHFVDEAFFVAFCANFGNSWFVTLSMKNSTVLQLERSYCENSRQNC